MEESKKPESVAKNTQQGAENGIIDLVDVVKTAPADGEEIIDLTDVVKKPDDGEIIDLVEVVPSPDTHDPVEAPAVAEFSDIPDITDQPEALLPEEDSGPDVEIEPLDLESEGIDFADVINESDIAVETVTTADMEPPSAITMGIEASETFPPEDLGPNGTMNALLDPDPSEMSNNTEKTELTETEKVKEALEVSDDVKIAFDDAESEQQEDKAPLAMATEDAEEQTTEDFIVLDDSTGDDDIDEAEKEEDELFDSMGMNIDPDLEGSETFPDIPVHALDRQPGETDDTADSEEKINRKDLEAAVESVLKKTFSEKIEQIITEVIEKAVHKEIEKLKKALSDEIDR